MSKSFIIASGKGGTGKTMFTSNLGVVLSQKGLSVIIVDMDMGMRNMDLYFGMENNMVYDAHDVMTGVCTIKQALLEDPRFPNLAVMGASPVKENGSITPLHSRVLVEKLGERADVILIDAPSGIDDGLVIASAGADAAIMITQPEYASLRNCDTVDRELMRLGIRERYLVVNKLNVKLMQEGYTPDLKTITQLMLPQLIGVIQEDPNINISTNLGIPIVQKRDSYIRRNFENIAMRLPLPLGGQKQRFEMRQKIRKTLEGPGPSAWEAARTGFRTGAPNRAETIGAAGTFGHTPGAVRRQEEEEEAAARAIREGRPVHPIATGLTKSTGVARKPKAAETLASSGSNFAQPAMARHLHPVQAEDDYQTAAPAEPGGLSDPRNNPFAVDLETDISEDQMELPPRMIRASDLPEPPD